MAVAQKLRCQVERIVDHGEHVYTVELQPERPVPRFHPGQFLHLALDAYDPSEFWPESRVFSIASSPMQRGRLHISYSVRGRFTARLEQELAVGRWVWVKLPYGDFVVQDVRDVVLFAGGTGITAFTAFIDGLTVDRAHQVTLFYGARRPELLIHRALIDVRAQAVSRFRVYYSVECVHDGSLDLSEWHAALGRLSVDAAWPVLRAPFNSDYYISGPPAMLKAISQDLRQRGIRQESIRIDAWE